MVEAKVKAEVKVIMGVDPGTNRTGYGVIEVCGNAVKCVVMGDIDLSKYDNPYSKLAYIFKRLSALIEQYKPSEVAYESPFFGTNVQSMLKLGRAQGVSMAAALDRGIPVFEYAPRRIKQSITGQGAASKEQVAAMLRTILGVEYDIKRLDATDGLAVAMCHHFESTSLLNRLPQGAKSAGLGGGLKSKRIGGSKSWESFLDSNPDRILKK